MALELLKILHEIERGYDYYHPNTFAWKECRMIEVRRLEESLAKGRSGFFRVLCIDNDSSSCESMQIILRLRGYEAFGVTSGVAALHRLTREDFDLVITDLILQGIDGIELVRRIRQMKPNQKIIVVTGFSSPLTQGRTFKLGTLSYLAKPFSGSRLLEVIEDTLQEDEEGLQGSIHLSCEELVQLHSFGQKSVTLEIRSNGCIGYIYLENGNPIHARKDSMSGEEAFFEILTWKIGVFIVHEGCKTAKRTIKNRADALLLEGARRQDECNTCVDKCILDNG